MTDAEYEPETKMWLVADLIDEVLVRIRLGVYDEERDGNLLAVLEEIERILR